MKLSICIPTYNRATLLVNCLASIQENDLEHDVQICISDNCSADETKQVVEHASKNIPIKYERNKTNIGLARNIIKVVEMAEGDFIWMIGDDDLLMHDAVSEVLNLMDKHENVDYFYVNSFHLTTEYVLSFPQPFALSNLPQSMKTFSSRSHSGEMPFLNMIDSNVSFDFLGGIFLSVFRRENWHSSVNVISQEKILDDRVFSNFDNTFPHVKIFAKAFSSSNAYFYAKPLSVCLTGAREWAPMSSLVRSVRLVEAVEQYRENGLPFLSYLRCKNYALYSFLPDIVFMGLHKNTSGFKYIKPVKLCISHCLYPNVYLSPLYFILRRIKCFFVG